MNESLPTSRKLAKLIEAKHYFKGAPCSKGHVALRHTSNGHCLECTRLRNAEAYRSNAEIHAAKRREYRATCKDAVRRSKQKTALKRKERVAAGETPPRRAYPERQRAWRQRNKTRVAAHAAQRRAMKMLRTPAWADLAAILEFWTACPPGCHVDHIIPLRGECISGLHVLENLQYLPSADNIRKKNTFIPYVVYAHD